jgi:dethiobiotin synthetase
MDANRIIFVTGTDTGVGKTLLTALLLYHLRKNGVRALAMKPFCSGGRTDVALLQSFQPGELSDGEMNPFHFDDPVAPLVAAKKHRQTIHLQDVIERIRMVKRKCDCLLVEGVGGLLVPLGKGYAVADLIAELDCQVIVAARNQLGTINHTLLTIHALKTLPKPPRRIMVVLMSGKRADLSATDNRKILRTLLRPVEILEIPFLGGRAARPGGIREGQTKAVKTLARLVAMTEEGACKKI